MSAIAPSAVDLIESHVPCVQCGYDLYASKRSGLCPECGKSVALSASASETFLKVENAVELRKMGSSLLVSSIFAGLCPGACLLAVQAENLAGPIAMSIAFSICAVFAGVGETRRRRGLGATPAIASRSSPLVADGVAAAGLVLINLAAYAYAIENAARGYSSGSAFILVLVCLGFFLLCVTAWRALPTWRAHADLAYLLNGIRLSKFLRFLAWTKATYETIWLFCCWSPFAFVAMGRPMEDLAVGLAFAALFGLFGFAAIWVLMIIAHAILLAQVRKATEPTLSCANP